MYLSSSNSSSSKTCRSLLALGLVIGFSCRAYAASDLIVENNTGATIRVSNTFGGPTSLMRPSVDIKTTKTALIPPVKNSTLKDFLSMGRNEISFESPCSKVQHDVDKVIWVTGEKKRHVIDIYEQDFGAHIMADRSGCSESLSGPQNKNTSAQADSGCRAIIGRWNWFTGYVTDFFSDGTWATTKDGHTGKWNCNSNGSVTVVPNADSWRDTVTVSADGLSLAGQNEKGVKVTAKRAPSK